MKVNVVKTVISIILSALLGLTCYYLASDVENRNWISFGVSFATALSLLIPAIGIDYNCGQRSTNVKLVAWLFAIAVVAANIIFSCFVYPIIIYVVVCSLIAVLGFLLIYSMVPKGEGN